MKKVIALALCLCLGLVGCGGDGAAPSAALADSPSVPPAPSASEPASSPAPAVQITLLAAGDNLIHDVIYWQAARRSGGAGYDFRPVYARTAGLIAGADVAVINQETVLASDVAPPASYPLFCSPTQLGEQLVEMGFDVFFLANNHAYDQGAQGVRASLDFWDTQEGVLTAGAYRNALEREKIPVLEVQGVRVAFLSCTQSTNGLALREDAPEGVVLLSQEDFLRRQLERAREEADLVVLSVHWGEEGARQPSREQRDTARRLAGWGADLILGTHPHVLQPWEEIPRAEGSSALAVYSLGNFVSAQARPEELAGGLLEVSIRKEEGCRAQLESWRLIPIVTHYGPGFRELRVIPLTEYTPQLAREHGVRAAFPDFDLNWLKELYGDLKLS